MSKVATVLVSCDTFGTHTHQIFCGLNILHKTGIIELHYVAPPKWLARRRTRQAVHLAVEWQGGVANHFYDLNDSSELAHVQALDYCDFYHKRSFNSLDYMDLGKSHKILPFGLNYQMSVGSFSDYLKRVMGDWVFHPYNLFARQQRPHVDTILKYSRDLMFANNKNKELISHDQLCSYPFFPKEKRVLFQCRLWDPMYFPESARDSINNLNLVRIDAVRALKKELGQNFFGGLQNNAYSKSVAGDLIVSHSTNRSKYLDLVKKSAVVVTTNGISSSIGWKMGEFVALSKAIVCEPLVHSVPGDFQNGKNYLSYGTSDQCVENCVKLMDNSEQAVKIMENNYSYYNRYLRPDILMLNSILAVATSPIQSE